MRNIHIPEGVHKLGEAVEYAQAQLAIQGATAAKATMDMEARIQKLKAENELLQSLLTDATTHIALASAQVEGAHAENFIASALATKIEIDSQARIHKLEEVNSHLQSLLADTQVHIGLLTNQLEGAQADATLGNLTAAATIAELEERLAQSEAKVRELDAALKAAQPRKLSSAALMATMRQRDLQSTEGEQPGTESTESSTAAPAA